MKILAYNKPTLLSQYEFKIIIIDNNITNKSELLVYLIDNYPDFFNNCADYNFYKIKDINKFKFHWDYSKLIDSNTELLVENDNIKDIENICVDYHHSQHNEDYIIDKIFNKIKTLNTTFVDIGSKDGKYISNVYSLIRQNWKVILSFNK